MEITAKNRPTILVFEKRSRIVPELQRKFLDEKVSIRGCRSTDDIFRLLGRTVDKLVVLDLEAGPADCLQLLGKVLSRPFPTLVIVVGSKRHADLECPVRELGAGEFVPEFLSAKSLARLCRRQLNLVKKQTS